jgi:hypothetical protein
MLAIWSEINFKPQYQRLTDIWPESKKQLFVDSLINGYDIPKLYFHDLSLGKTTPSRRYAIIDGKQRLDAIKAFVDGQFSLSEEFEDVEQVSPEAARRGAGLAYRDVAKKLPELRLRFEMARLPIVLVQTDDLGVIEEMFTRLNEALPLNAPEKRNALGGPLPSHIRSLARSRFFTSKLAFQNGRYRHLDLATKFLYVEHKRGIVDLKKKLLDDFVKDFKRNRRATKAAELHERCKLILEKMEVVFTKTPDPLLDSVGMITVYYVLFRNAFEQRWLTHITRPKLEAFETARIENRERLKQINELVLEDKKIPADLHSNPVLAAFERYVQSPNDYTALHQRYRILRQFIETGVIPATEPAD